MKKISFKFEVEFEFAEGINTLDELKEAMENGLVKNVRRRTVGTCKDDSIGDDKGFFEFGEQAMLRELTKMRDSKPLLKMENLKFEE